MGNPSHARVNRLKHSEHVQDRHGKSARPRSEEQTTSLLFRVCFISTREMSDHCPIETLGQSKSNHSDGLQPKLQAYKVAGCLCGQGMLQARGPSITGTICTGQGQSRTHRKRRRMHQQQVRVEDAHNRRIISCASYDCTIVHISRFNVQKSRSPGYIASSQHVRRSPLILGLAVGRHWELRLRSIGHSETCHAERDGVWNARLAQRCGAAPAQMHRSMSGRQFEVSNKPDRRCRQA